MPLNSPLVSSNRNIGGDPSLPRGDLNPTDFSMETSGLFKHEADYRAIQSEPLWTDLGLKIEIGVCEISAKNI